MSKKHPWLVIGILAAGAVALFAAAASAKGGEASGPPIEWHPELNDPAERQFVWSELQNRSGTDIATRGNEYEQTILGSGNRLSTMALAILAEEAVKKMTPDEVLRRAP